MESSTDIVKIKCGQIYILSNDNFTLICEFCTRDFFDLDAFRTHVADHFPENVPPIKNDCGSLIKQEIIDFPECQVLIDELGPADNQPSEGAEEETQAGELSKGLQPIIEKENENTTNVKVKKNLHNTKSNTPRIKEPVPQDDTIQKVVNETIDSDNEPSDVLEEGTQASELSKGLHPISENESENTTNIKVNNNRCNTRQSKKPRIKEPVPDKPNTSATPDNENDSKKIRTKGFQCSFCPKIFRQTRDHEEHENTHSGRRPYECPICFKTFARAQSFVNHNLVHTDDFPYNCSMCDQKFKARSKLNRHVREKHLPDTDPRRYFPCKICDTKFVTLSQMAYHRISKHKINTTDVFTCDYCQKEFPHKLNLSLHMNMHSRAKVFKCQFCNKSFLYRNSKSKHERTQHRDIAF